MNNLDLWNKVKTVPDTAKKTIGGGRLKGMTDINPQFRLKTLTEQFGICGYGWRYEIIKSWLEKGFGDTVAAFVEINLYIKNGGEWSAAIPGTGGSMFIAKEDKGPYTSDECYKMALTDALSVACKALGVGADVYWDKDASKYDKPQETAKAPSETPAKQPEKPTTESRKNPQGDAVITPDDLMPIIKACTGKDGKPIDAELFRFKSIYQRFNYHEAKEIRVKDWPQIRKEFLDHALPANI